MPSAIQFDRKNGDVTINGDIYLKKEAMRFANEAKQTGNNVVDTLRLALPDKTGNFRDHSETRRIGDDINNYPLGKPYSVALRDAPVTVERLAYYPKEGDQLVDAGTARVNVAASNEAPEGTTQDSWAKEHEHETVSTLLNRLAVEILTVSRLCNSTASTGTKTATASFGHKTRTAV